MEREHTPQPEEKNINLEKYGYNDKTRIQSERLQEILRNDSKKIVNKSAEIFGSKLSAYIAKRTKTADIQEWIQGDSQSPEEMLIRLGIGLDFTYQMRKEGYKTDAVARALFIGQKPQFNDQAMVTALRSVDSEDLAIVHAAFDEIIEAERECVFYSAQTIYPGLEKYFLPPPEQEVYKKK